MKNYAQDAPHLPDHTHTYMFKLDRGKRFDHVFDVAAEHDEPVANRFTFASGEYSNGLR
jgi:hypothetical protein